MGRSILSQRYFQISTFSSNNPDRRICSIQFKMLSGADEYSVRLVESQGLKLYYPLDNCHPHVQSAARYLHDLTIFFCESFIIEICNRIECGRLTHVMFLLFIFKCLYFYHFIIIMEMIPKVNLERNKK